MTEIDPIAVEANYRAAPLPEGAPPREKSVGHSQHHEINERRALTENADALRRIRAL
jgi:hypothetical protein